MREKLLMNRGWRFYYGEPAVTAPKAGDQYYRSSRAENGRGPARREFDDRSWKTVHIPHDFVFEAGLGERGGTGSRGTAWYRRSFRLNEEDRNRRITLYFAGVSTACDVYVNSIFLKHNSTAGIGFEVDITEMARFGADLNVVSVHVDCTDNEGWYYEGGGLYRDVFLIKTDPVCVDMWGTYVKYERVADTTWEAELWTDVRNAAYEERAVRVLSQVFDPHGVFVGSAQCEVFVGPGEVEKAVQPFVFEDPILWSTRENNKYLLKTLLYVGDQLVDTYETPFGIREVVFTCDKGLFINGENVKVMGFGNHQTHRGAGNAMSDSMREFQISRLADMGANGWRTVHSPHGEAMYDYCDKYGQLIMDENRIFHPSDVTVDEVERMVKRDRNHPSLLFYSLYNEEDLITTETGKRIFRKLARAARKLDPMRKFSGATSYGIYTEGAHEYQDLLGINHQSALFPKIHATKPNLPLYGSEMGGLNFGKVLPGHTVEGVKTMMECEYVFGGYGFTGWGNNIDLLGRPLEGYYTNQSMLLKTPVVKIWPEWNDVADKTQPVQVRVCTNGDKVELFLNGRSLGVKDTSVFDQPQFTVDYEPGTISAKVYKDGKLWGEDSSCSAGAPVAVRLVCENKQLKNDGEDVAIVTASLVDEKGVICHDVSGLRAKFACNEAGQFINATVPSVLFTPVPNLIGEELTFEKGRCQAFYRSLPTEGDLVITLQAEGLPEAKLAIARQMTGPGAFVPEIEGNYVHGWKISPTYVNEEFDEEAIIGKADVSQWQDALLMGAPGAFDGKPAPIPLPMKWIYTENDKLYCAYYTTAIVPDLGEKDGKKLCLHFEGFDGMGKCVILCGDKRIEGLQLENSPWPGHFRPTLRVDCDELKPGDKVEIWATIYNGHRVGGITWPVRWDYR